MVEERELVKKKIEFKNSQEAVAVCGRHDENVRLIDRELGVRIISRGNEVTIEGEAEEVQKALRFFEAKSILKGIKGIKFIYFNGKDVVRHELVQEIIKAYGKG